MSGIRYDDWHLQSSSGSVIASLMSRSLSAASKSPLNRSRRSSFISALLRASTISTIYCYPLRQRLRNNGYLAGTGTFSSLNAWVTLLVRAVRFIAQLGRISFKIRSPAKVRSASLKVIWWPGGTITSEVHVTRRPNPRTLQYANAGIE
jgi:hypothetical protein